MFSLNINLFLWHADFRATLFSKRGSSRSYRSDYWWRLSRKRDLQWSQIVRVSHETVSQFHAAVIRQTLLAFVFQPQVVVIAIYSQVIFLLTPGNVFQAPSPSDGAVPLGLPFPQMNLLSTPVSQGTLRENRTDWQNSPPEYVTAQTQKLDGQQQHKKKTVASTTMCTKTHPHKSRQCDEMANNTKYQINPPMSNNT